MHREPGEISEPGLLLDLPDLPVNSDGGLKRAAEIDAAPSRRSRAGPEDRPTYGRDPVASLSSLAPAGFASSAGAGPALPAGAGEQRRRAPLRDRCLAPPQDDRVVAHRRRSALEGVPARPSAGVVARRQESPLAAALHRLQRAHVIVLAARLQDAELVAGPAGSAVTVSRLHVRQVAARVRPSLLTGLLPERDPLARMGVADALRRAHDDEYQSPRRHVREIAPARC